MKNEALKQQFIQNAARKIVMSAYPPWATTDAEDMAKMRDLEEIRYRQAWGQVAHSLQQRREKQAMDSTIVPYTKGA